MRGLNTETGQRKEKSIEFEKNSRHAHRGYAKSLGFAVFLWCINGVSKTYRTDRRIVGVNAYGILAYRGNGF